MKKPNPCHLETLAHNEMCAVEYCGDCSAFHVNIGFATVRLNLPALRAVSATLAVALNRLDRRAAANRCSADEAPAVNENLH